MAHAPSHGMSYVHLGKSGLKVSRIVLGCMTYGSPLTQAWVLPEKEAIEHIKAAYNAGINAFDTANVYSNGESERILGVAIKQLKLPREEIVVMTKVFVTVCRTPDENGMRLTEEELGQRRYTNQQGLSRKHIFESIRHSLDRLQLDYVDVLQCHRFDPNTPIEETMQALHDVVKAGLVRYIGMSSCRAWQLHKMQNYALQNNLTPFISMQNSYSAIYREEEREMMPLLQDLGLGCMPWCPLGGGFLTRPLGSETRRSQLANAAMTSFQDYVSFPFLATIHKRVEEIAQRRGISMAQVVLAWVLSKKFVTAPVVGASSLDHLHDLIAGVKVELTADEIKYIDEPYQPRQVWFHK